jgi:hypothetical protein
MVCVTNLDGRPLNFEQRSLVRSREAFSVAGDRSRKRISRLTFPKIKSWKPYPCRKPGLVAAVLLTASNELQNLGQSIAGF